MFYLVWYVVLLVRMWCRVSFQRFTPVLCWFLLWWERDNINTNGSTCCFVHLDEIKLHFQRMFWSGICQRRLISSKSSQNSSINRPFFASQIQVFSINRKLESSPPMRPQSLNLHVSLFFVLSIPNITVMQQLCCLSDFVFILKVFIIWLNVIYFCFFPSHIWYFIHHWT